MTAPLENLDTIDRIERGEVQPPDRENPDERGDTDTVARIDWEAAGIRIIGTGHET